MSRFDHLELPSEEMDSVKKEGLAPQDLDYFLREADLAWRRGNFDKGLRHFSKALSFNHDLEEAWVGQIRCLVDLDEVKEARLWANKGLERLPRSGLLMGAKSLALERMWETVPAMELCDQALNLKQDSWYLWIVRGTILSGRGLKTAEYCFLKSLELEPRDLIIPLRIGMAYLDAKDYHLALPHLRNAAQGDPTNPLALWKYGLCLAALGWPHQALPHYHAALDQKTELAPQIKLAVEKAKRGGLVQWLRGFWSKMRSEQA